MYDLKINTNWTFKDIVNEIKALKLEYEGVLTSFSCYEIKDKINFKRNLRNSFYALDFEEWKKDKIWDYMNGFEVYEVLQNICSRLK